MSPAKFTSTAHLIGQGPPTNGRVNPCYMYYTRGTNNSEKHFISRSSPSVYIRLLKLSLHSAPEGQRIHSAPEGHNAVQRINLASRCQESFFQRSLSSVTIGFIYRHVLEFMYSYTQYIRTYSS